MSMCFFHEGVLYADRFQITDYKDYIPRLVDNKIFITKDKAAVTIMGRVPKDIDDFLERIDRILFVYKESFKNPSKTASVNSLLTMEKSIKLLNTALMITYKNKSTIYVTLKYENNKISNVEIGINETISLFCPRNTNELLSLGIPPADIFRGSSINKGTVSKEHTAYSLKLNKFIQTDF